MKHDRDTVVLVATNNQPPAAGHGTIAGGDRGVGVVTRYAQAANKDVLVSACQQVTRVGTYDNSTGCHLHLRCSCTVRSPPPRCSKRTAAPTSTGY